MELCPRKITQPKRDGPIFINGSAPIRFWHEGLRSKGAFTVTGCEKRCSEPETKMAQWLSMNEFEAMVESGHFPNAAEAGLCAQVCFFGYIIQYLIRNLIIF